jgi:short-subunit dehydrogenase
MHVQAAKAAFANHSKGLSMEVSSFAVIVGMVHEYTVAA